MWLSAYLKDRLWPRLFKAYERWQEDDGHLLAAAVSYYAALSFFPLLLILISGLGMVLQYSLEARDAQATLLEVISDRTAPGVAEQVKAALDQVRTNAAVGGPVGLLMLLVAAIGIFVQFDTAFNRIWNVPEKEAKGFLVAIRRALVDRLKAFLMLLGLGLLIIAAFVGTMTISTVLSLIEFAGSRWVWQVAQAAISVGINCVLLSLIYKLLPRVKIRWSEAFRGGLLAAIVWEAGRMVLAAFLVGGKYSAYGIVGSFIAILLWIYYATTVLFLGAEYIQVICQECELERPKKPASPQPAATAR